MDGHQNPKCHSRVGATMFFFTHCTQSPSSNLTALVEKLIPHSVSFLAVVMSSFSLIIPDSLPSCTTCEMEEEEEKDGLLKQGEGEPHLPIPEQPVDTISD